MQQYIYHYGLIRQYFTKVGSFETINYKDNRNAMNKLRPCFQKNFTLFKDHGKESPGWLDGLSNEPTISLRCFRGEINN